MEAFLRSVNVLDRSVMVAEGKIYQVKETSLARESFDLLASSRVSALIVVNDANEAIDVLDHGDILSSLWQFYMNPSKASSQNLTARVARFHFMENMNIASLLTRSSWHEGMFTLTHDATLWDAALLLSSKAHRVVILDQHRHAVNVIGQATLVQAILGGEDEVSKLSDCLNRSLAMLNIPPTNVVYVNASLPASAVLKTMLDHKVRAVAVENDSGQLVSAVSTTDVKVFCRGPMKLDLLDEPCLSFLMDIRQSCTDITQTIFSITSAATLKATIQQFYTERIHRLFVSDEAGKACGVISYTDVIRVLLSC